MTELSHEPAVPESELEHPEKTSPWIMLTSMSLLIAGLLLASATLIHRAQEKTGNSNTAFLDLSEFIKKGQSLSSQAKSKVAEKSEVQTTDTEPKASQARPSGITRFFSGMNNGIRWPKLKLTGFGKSADGESGFAIINEKYVIEGQKISKVTLIEIGPHSVVVEYKDERKILTVDSAK